MTAGLAHLNQAAGMVDAMVVMHPEFDEGWGNLMSDIRITAEQLALNDKGSK